MELEQLRGPSSGTGTPRACYRSISIFAPGGWDVCDSAHWLDVMNLTPATARVERTLLSAAFDLVLEFDPGCPILARSRR